MTDCYPIKKKEYMYEGQVKLTMMTFTVLLSNDIILTDRTFVH
jgi:hypothetical protein